MLALDGPNNGWIGAMNMYDYHSAYTDLHLPLRRYFWGKPAKMICDLLILILRCVFTMHDCKAVLMNDPAGHLRHEL